MGKLGHILVKDDAEVTRDLLTQLLEDDYRVTVATGGQEAIEAIERDRPDMLILDLLMPAVDGFAVLEYLLAHPEPFLPVIVRSASQDRNARVRALKLGANEFLGSPFNEEELEVRLKSLMSLKRSRESADRRREELESVVTDRTRALRNALEDLKQTNTYKNEFLSVMSHELRTPLGFIIAFASSLDDGLAGDLTEQQHEFVARILEGGERMQGLVENLLDISLIVTGQFELEVAAAPMEPQVEQALTAARAFAAAHHVTLTVDVCAPTPIDMDASRVLQVLINLLRNAIRFTPAGGQVTLHMVERADRLLTKVIDTGIGISRDDLPRLFQPFKQVDMTATRKVGGLGLGLKLAKGIVEAHGGHIGARSMVGRGSTFWFDLPFKSPQAAG